MDPQRRMAEGHDCPAAEPSPSLTATGSTPPTPQTLAAFGLPDEQQIALPYGEERTYRVGHAVLKNVHYERAAVVSWIADLHASLPEDGYRLARPLPVLGGGWIADGWTATTFLVGHHDYRQQVAGCVAAIARYHAALQSQPRPGIFDTVDNPYWRADHHAFGERPATVHPDLEAPVDALYAVRTPLVGLDEQLIHGDLNPSNVLLADGQAPGIIDMAPYWRPASFALAVFGYWIGPWRNRPDLLAHFDHVDQFDQLLVRAAIRMLLIMSESGRLTDMARYTRATRSIVARNGG